MSIVFALSPSRVHMLVAAIARRAGLPETRPHDLRRSYARLSREGGAPIEQIQVTLGHASVRTTELYLGTELELREGKAAGDHIRLELSESERGEK